MAATPDYDSWSLPQLKAELKGRKLPVSGIKIVLKQRLINSDNRIEYSSPKFHIPKDFPYKVRDTILSILRNECVKMFISRQYGNPEIFQVAIESLKLNTSITSLHLQSIATKHVDGGRLLGDLINSRPTLTHLALSNCFLEPEGTFHIAKALYKNTTLKSLHLGSSQVYAKGAEYIADMLKTNTTLEKLRLPLSYIQCEGAIAIAEALSINTSLRKLDISFNGIKDEGAIAIAHSLHTNTSLHNLNLENHRDIGDPGFEALNIALGINTKLRKFKIDIPKYDYCGFCTKYSILFERITP